MDSLYYSRSDTHTLQSCLSTQLRHAHIALLHIAGLVGERFVFGAFLPLLIVGYSEDGQESGKERGERHAVKVVMNGTRTRDTLSG